MESLEQRQKQSLKEKRLLARLQLATTRVKDVERERIWAIAAAHSEGLSIRKIAEEQSLNFRVLGDHPDHESSPYLACLASSNQVSNFSLLSDTHFSA